MWGQSEAVKVRILLSFDIHLKARTGLLLILTVYVSSRETIKVEQRWFLDRQLGEKSHGLHIGYRKTFVFLKITCRAPVLSCMSKLLPAASIPHWPQFGSPLWLRKVRKVLVEVEAPLTFILGATIVVPG